MNLLPFVIGLEMRQKAFSDSGRTFQISLQVKRFQVSQQLGCRHQWIRILSRSHFPDFSASMAISSVTTAWLPTPVDQMRQSVRSVCVRAKRPAKKRNLIQLFEKTRSQKIQQSKEKLKIQENKNQKFQIPNSKKTRSPKSKKLNLGNSKNQRQWPSRRLGKLQKHLVVDLGRLSSSSNGK